MKFKPIEQMNKASSIGFKLDNFFLISEIIQRIQIECILEIILIQKYRILIDYNFEKNINFG